MKKLFGLLILASVALLMSFTISEGGLELGDTAPDFSLMSTSDQEVSLSDYPDAKGYIVIFTCNHCPYSVMYEDRIIDIHNKWADKGFPVIAINPNDPAVQPKDGFAEMKMRAEEKAFPFPYLFDDGQKVYPAYGASRTPHVFILDSDKKVQYIGAIDDNARDAAAAQMNYVDNAVMAISEGKSVDPGFTKAIGCSIKSL